MLVLLLCAAMGPLNPFLSVEAKATEYYVRATAGSDANPGTTPAQALRSVSRLPRVMQPGDTAYVGPGLYRDMVVMTNRLADGPPITFIADPTGRRVGDLPGPVIVAGSDPIDPALFEAGPAPRTYRARIPPPVLGVVEMDGPQVRYTLAVEAKEHVFDKLPEDQVVASLPSTYRYDEATGTLVVHTSDGRPPRDHEIEIIRRSHGFLFNRARHVTVQGFVLRHSGMAGIEFFNGSNGGLASGNVSFGHHQGIQANRSPGARIVGNTLFRNDNAGLYFLAESTGGLAVGNVSFENVKGIRIGSKSGGIRVLENRLFGNHERGLSIEYSDGVAARRNSLADNRSSQLLVIDSQYEADHNCFANGSPDEVVADFFHKNTRYATLAAYQRARHNDLGSRQGSCELPAALPDVHALERFVTTVSHTP